MKRVVSTVLALAAGALTSAAPLSAQRVEANQFAIDGSIGFAVPTQSARSTGVDIMGAFEWKPAQLHSPFWFRGEIGYSNFGVNNCDCSVSALRFIADAIYPFHIPATPLVPYAIAGVGIYHQSDGRSSTGVGFNFGGGVRYPIAGVEPYFELRYHAVFDSDESDYLPFQFGVRFKLP